jgi:hypothetical protein
MRNILVNYNIPTIDPSIFEGLSKMAQQHQAMAQSFSLSMKPIIKQNQELAKRLNNILPKTDSSIFDNLKVVQSMFNNSEFTKFAQQQKKLAENLSFTLSKIDTSFIDDLNKFSKELKTINFDKELFGLENIDSDIKYEDIETINNKIKNDLTLDKNDISLFVSIISFIFAVYVHYFPNNSLQTMEDLDKKTLCVNTNQTVYYEVTKQVHVRENSTIESKKLDILFPKHKLLIIQNKPYWIQVEYFDKKKKETVIGWVSKRYTKRLNND